MQIQIFKAGFNPEDFNKFINSVITLKFESKENGDVYVWFQPFTELAMNKAAKMETVFNMISAAEKEIVIYDADIFMYRKKITELKKEEEIAKSNTEGNGKKIAYDFAKDIKENERAILMAEESKLVKQRQIDSLQELASSY